MIDKTARDLDYLTPERILAPVRAYFYGKIPLDPATLPENPTRAMYHYALPDIDGLAVKWTHGAFCNPPYGKELKPWIAKIHEEAIRGTEIIALLPVTRTEQAYFHDLMREAEAVCWVRSRVAFLRPSTGKPAKGNPRASALWGFNVALRRFVAAFSETGLVHLLRAAPGSDPGPVATTDIQW